MRSAHACVWCGAGCYSSVAQDDAEGGDGLMGLGLGVGVGGATPGDPVLAVGEVEAKAVEDEKQGCGATAAPATDAASAALARLESEAQASGGTEERHSEVEEEEGQQGDRHHHIQEGASESSFSSELGAFDEQQWGFQPGSHGEEEDDEEDEED